MGVRPFEVPVTYHGRTHEQGKKLSWRDGVSASGSSVASASPARRAPRATSTPGSGERAATVERPDPPRPLTRRFPDPDDARPGAVLGSALLALGLAQSDGGRALLDDAGLAPPEEPYTALAFARPAELPRRPAQAPRSRSPSTSTITKARAEPILVGRRALGRGRRGALRRPGRRGGRRPRHRPHARLPRLPGRRARIAVVLEEPSREIGFWAACPGSEAAS